MPVNARRNLRVELNEVEQKRECESKAMAPGDASRGLLLARWELALALGGYPTGVGAIVPATREGISP